ncbi:unnamed protein product [Phytophthora lilii]|uniref:RNA helicase n=1 Tax=Phytophthora lilii TaxID=2077276 RepID=A0A9W6UBS7_9STRA|nr:unnamed protein product [Phytophthora lilii]
MRGITDMKTALLVGGFSVPTQRYRLQGGVQLIVATPGRFLDIFTNYSDGDAILSTICTCVIDEIDVMLDVGFRPQILQIVSLLASLTDKCRDGVQLLFLSATVSDEVEGMVRQTLTSQHCQNIVRIQVKSNATKASASGASRYALNPRIQQQIRWAENKAKKNELFSFLSGKEEESTLVFVASKVGATMLAEAIGKRCGISAAAIHADKTQHERLKLLEAFINLEIHVLVSTNVLSRGMDLLHVQNVVVYDFPHKVADYVHLIGRTGRSDDINGTALTLMNPKDSPAFRELIPLLRQAKVSVPQEMYQRLHSEYGKQHARSAAIVMDESRRAFRIPTQLSDDIGAQMSEWKQWNYHGTKRRRFG